MIRRLFERKPGYQAQVLAEAQCLVDDGLELEFVLDLFPDEAEWLHGMLVVVSDLEDAYAVDQPSYYFEASLKAKFLGRARDPRPVVPVVVSAPAYSPVRTAVATMSVATTAAALGILSLGFVTAGDSVPGDWNYTFKLANERFETTLSRGDSRVDVKLRQAEERVFELGKLSDRGDVSESQLAKLQREIEELRVLRQKDLDASQKTRAQNLANSGNAVLTEIAEKQPELGPRVAAVVEDFDEVVSAAVGSGTVVALDPAPTASPPATVGTPTPGASASASPAASGTPSPTPASETPTPGTATPSPTKTETPTATGSPSPTETTTPDPSATSTEEPLEEETPTPERPEPNP